MPLELRRTQLALTYWANLKGHSEEHPTQATLMPCWEKERRETRSFGWTAAPKAKEMNMDKLNFSPTVPLPAIAPWILPEATVDFALLKKKSKDRGGTFNMHTIQAHIDSYHSYVQVYTDASKNLGNKVGIAVIVPEFNTKIGKMITEGVSVYTGEMLAIMFALQWIEDTRPLRAIICSDSSSSLDSLQNSHSDSRPDILIEIQMTLYRIQMMGMTVVFVWVPAHVGVRGNEMADRAAKEAAKSSCSKVEVNISKTESIIKKRLKERWQKEWEEDRKGRWFFRVQSKVGEMRCAGGNRRDETVISRLRFGHTGLNGMLWKIGKHDTGRCDYCGQEETVEHVVQQCQRYEQERRQLVGSLCKEGVRLGTMGVLQSNSSGCYKALLQYLRITRIIDRI